MGQNVQEIPMIENCHKYKKSQYPVNPDICRTCQYGRSYSAALVGVGDYMCRYVGITGHNKPKGSTFENCTGYSKGNRLPNKNNIWID